MAESADSDFSLNGRGIEDDMSLPLRRNGETEISKQSSGSDDIASGPRIDSFVVIDASNVAWAGPGKPQISRIITVLLEFDGINVPYICIADATLRHTIDDNIAYENLISQGKINQVPAGTSADMFIREIKRRLMPSSTRPILLTNDLKLARSSLPAICLKFLFVTIGQSMHILFYPRLEDLGLKRGSDNK
ncbi:MAG: hypothetical protein M1556_01380 [Candidatus Thermoplasmatota archaeon]|jgi:hypothetical protein|nr:hypothetical protein [Candidatus Thermoplasmatota archaeon]MCL6002287.1 hypothetical protein [Candidatus Thermoplasmatota archaeon]